MTAKQALLLGNGSGRAVELHEVFIGNKGKVNRKGAGFPITDFGNDDGRATKSYGMFIIATTTATV